MKLSYHAKAVDKTMETFINES